MRASSGPKANIWRVGKRSVLLLRSEALVGYKNIWAGQRKKNPSSGKESLSKSGIFVGQVRIDLTGAFYIPL